MPIHVRLNISQTKKTEANSESYVDLDSHADTCVLGNNSLLIETPYPERHAIVSFADPSLGTVNKPILSGAFKYTSPADGTSYILVVHQAIHIDTMNHSLLCPMQLRANDVILDECPKSMTETPTKETHSLLLKTEDNNTLRIPLMLRGVTSTFPITKPTLHDFDILPIIELTSHDLEWDPQSRDFAEAEAQFLDTFGNFKPPGDKY